jgi:hypothetical protein
MPDVGSGGLTAKRDGDDMPPELNEAVADLPWGLRESVLGYVDAVEAALSDILIDAGVELAPPEIRDFLFVVGLWRLWGIVSGQFETVNYALKTLERQGVSSLRLGRTSLTRESTAYAEMRDLRDSLRRALATNELRFVTFATSLRELAQEVASNG